MSLIYFYRNNFTVPELEESQNLKSHFGVTFKSSHQNFQDLCGVNIQEKHLPSYNYLGSGTHLDIRLSENNIPEESINAIDQLTCIHDIAYRNSDNIEGRHRAYQEMINGLKNLKNPLLTQKLIKAMII